MRTPRHQALGYGERGVTMLEVLITIIILSFGLLGLAGLQARVHLAEIEAYQRGQAVVLLQDMVDRLNANRQNSMSYANAAVGTGNTIMNCAALTGANLDLCEWNNALLGSAETKSGQSIGAMTGARGCIINTMPTMPREFVVSVVWQGVTPTVAPASTTCGENLYGNDATRRALVARVIIGCLKNDPVTGACTTL
jgi:type IV pilus assembly protein PilV